MNDSVSHSYILLSSSMFYLHGHLQEISEYIGERCPGLHVCRKTDKIYVDAVHGKSAPQLLNSIYSVGYIFVQK